MLPAAAVRFSQRLGDSIQPVGRCLGAARWMTPAAAGEHFEHISGRHNDADLLAGEHMPPAVMDIAVRQAVLAAQYATCAVAQAVLCVDAPLLSWRLRHRQPGTLRCRREGRPLHRSDVLRQAPGRASSSDVMRRLGFDGCKPIGRGAARDVVEQALMRGSRPYIHDLGI